MEAQPNTPSFEEQQMLRTRNLIQVALAEQANVPLDEWIDLRGEKVGNLIDDEPHILELYLNDADEAFAYIDKKLAEREAGEGKEAA